MHHAEFENFRDETYINYCQSRVYESNLSTLQYRSVIECLVSVVSFTRGVWRQGEVESMTRNLMPSTQSKILIFHICQKFFYCLGGTGIFRVHKLHLTEKLSVIYFL